MASQSRVCVPSCGSKQLLEVNCYSTTHALFMNGRTMYICVSSIILRYWFGNTSDVPYKACAGEMLSSLRTDGRPRRTQGSSAGAAGAKGVPEATVEACHHPIGLGVVNGGWLVLDL